MKKALMDLQLVVWIIDDDLVSLFATRYGIEQWDQAGKVVVFDNGEAALETLSNILETGTDIPDIILLDLVMPNMNGWDFLSKFEAMHGWSRHIGIYILSAFANSKDREKARSHPSVKGYFDKPISKDVFDNVFQKYLMASKSV